MNRFKNAIVKKPCKNMVKGLSDAALGIPDYKLAMQQHETYIEALQECGLKVKVLEVDEGFPDSTFIEDVALFTPKCAIITNPGAQSRKGEIAGMYELAKEYYAGVERIHSPGTVEAGDIMMVGNHYYIGLSARTNLQGAEQMIEILSTYGMTGSVVKLEKVLHLKTGMAYLENNKLVACGEFLRMPEFQSFDIIEIPEAESYAANCIWINDRVLVPKGFPVARQRIAEAGYAVIELDMSEFQKLDGGLSCLSLRF